MMRIHPLHCGLGYAFLIEAAHGLALIDSGSPGQQARVLAKLKELGRDDLHLIWITHAHYDHYGSAAALRELTGACIGVHPADADSLAKGFSPLGTAHRYGIVFSMLLPLINRFSPLPACVPDFTLEDGESLQRFGLDATILHTPGHTPGHSCLLMPDGTAFAADLIGRIPRPRLQSLVATDWTQLQDSWVRFLATQPQWVYTGHSHKPVLGSMLQNLHIR